MPSILLATNYTRSTFTLSDLRERVRGDLAYEDDDFITDNDIVRWANSAQRELALVSQAFEITTVMGVSGDVAEYALPDESTGRAYAIIEVLYDDDPLPFFSLAALYSHDPNWRTRGSGTPQWYYLRGMSGIGLYPTPASGDPDILTVTYRAVPPVVTEDEDQYYVPQGCEDGIIDYCKLHASLKDAFGEGRERIAYYRSEWEKWKVMARQVVAQSHEHEAVHMGEYANYTDFPGNATSFPANTVASSV